MIVVGRVIALFLCLFSGLAAWYFLIAWVGTLTVGLIDEQWWGRHSGLVFLVGYPVGVAVLLLSGIFGWWLRILIGARNPSGRERAQFERAADRLQEKYEELHGRRLRDFRFQVVDADIFNAMALPGRTVTFTTKLLRHAKDKDEDGAQMLYGVLAHELGHIHHGDTSQTLWMQALLWPLAPFVWTARLSVRLFAWLCAIPIIGMLLLLFQWIFIAMVWICVLPERLAWSVLGLTSKAGEWRADRFAFNIGGRKGLQLFLEEISGEDVYTGGTLMDHYQRSHPPVELRLDRLERLAEEAEQAPRQSC